MRRNDSPILNLLGDGADFNQNSQQGFAGTVGLVYPQGVRMMCELGLWPYWICKWKAHIWWHMGDREA